MTFKEAIKKISSKTKGIDNLDFTEELEAFDNFLKETEALRSEHQTLTVKLKSAEDDISKRDGIIKESKKKDAIQLALNSADFEPSLKKGVEAILSSLVREVDSDFVIDGKSPKDYVQSWIKNDGKSYLAPKPSTGLSDVPTSSGLNGTKPTKLSNDNSVEGSLYRMFSSNRKQA